MTFSSATLGGAGEDEPDDGAAPSNADRADDHPLITTMA
jgi:hypothetical protein